MSVLEDDDELRNRLAVNAARIDQLRAQVLEAMRGRPDPESLDGLLLRVEDELRELRSRAAQR